MISQEEPRLRYSYRFRLEASTPAVFDADETKTEIQSYINDLLGVREKPEKKVDLYTV